MSLSVILLGIVLPALYMAIGIVVARLVAGHLAWSWRMNKWASDKYRYPLSTPDAPPVVPNGEQWFGAALLGLLIGAVWPLAVVLRLANVERWAIGAEAQAIARKREERIAELERKLEIQ